MGEVTPLFEGSVAGRPKGEPNDELVALLEQLVEDARSGQLQAIAYTGVTDMRALNTNWCGICDQHDMIAGVHVLSHRLLTACDFDG